MDEKFIMSNLNKKDNMKDVLISDNKELLDLSLIHQYLSNESYWAKGISLERVKLSIENSLCMGFYLDNKQIGFCRMVTDYATFAYLGDVFILGEFRGFGYSKALVDKIMNHEKLKGIRRFMLATSDAHNLYSKFDFKALKKPELFMEINKPNIYQNKK